MLPTSRAKFLCRCCGKLLNIILLHSIVLVNANCIAIYSAYLTIKMQYAIHSRRGMYGIQDSAQ